MSKPVILRAIINFANPTACDIARLNSMLAVCPTITMQKIYMIRADTELIVYSDDRAENIKLLSDYTMKMRGLKNVSKLFDKE